MKSTQTKGNLYLIPNLISRDGGEISIEVKNAIRKIPYYLAENELVDIYKGLPAFIFCPGPSYEQFKLHLSLLF